MNRDDFDAAMRDSWRYLDGGGPNERWLDATWRVAERHADGAPSDADVEAWIADHREWFSAWVAKYNRIHGGIGALVAAQADTTAPEATQAPAVAEETQEAPAPATGGSARRTGAAKPAARRRRT